MATQTITPVSIHVFSNNPTTSYSDFSVLWHLVDTSSPPQNLNGKEWKGISEGDLIIFPSLLSGAGEFESVRIAGAVTVDDFSTEGKAEQVVPLLTAGIEYPEFPTLIVNLARKRGTTLREMYEQPFEAVMAMQNLTMNDLFGGDSSAYEEFWNDPPVARRRRPPGREPWRISLGECVWVKSLEGADLLGDGIRSGNDEL